MRSLVAALITASGQAQFVTGTYDGDGAASHPITQLGFQPDVVLVKASSAERAVLRSASMTGDNTKPLIGAVGLTSNLITSLDSGGFTVGSDSRVNSAGLVYYFVAAKSVTDELATGTYSGTGSAQDITVGFTDGDAPDYVIIMSAGADIAVHRSSAMASRTYAFDADAGDPSGITTFNAGPSPANGFRVGAILPVNQLGQTYHWVAWNTAIGKMKTDFYSGNGSDSRPITGVGFQPEYCIVRKDESESVNSRGAHKPASTGPSADVTLDFGVQANETDRIQALQSDGFQLGTHETVNETGKTYAYMCFVRSCATCVSEAKLRQATARGYDGGVLLRWRTEYEADNLGFHVIRELGGKKTRVTRSLVAGSALLVGPRVALSAGRSYAFWDPTPQWRNTNVRYWIEDIALDGKRSQHGPWVPAGVGGPRPRIVVSPMLGALGHVGRPRQREQPAHARSLTRIGEGTPWRISKREAKKVLVRTDGWLRVMIANPSRQRLYVDGQEEPLRVSDESVEFFGQGTNTAATDTRVYWLVENDQPGLRVTTEEGNRLGSVAQSFPLSIERHDRTVYFAALSNGELENFFGPVITREPVNQWHFVHHLAGSEATVDVTLQGASAGSHHVRVLFNKMLLGEIEFAGMSRGRASFSPRVVEGNNVVTLVALGGEADISLVDSIRLTYQHATTADQNALHFTVSGDEIAVVNGFTSAAVRVFDITNRREVTELATTVQARRNDFAVTVAPARSGTRELIAVADDAVDRPAAVVLNQPSDLRNEPGADLVVIAPGDLLDSVEPLIAERRAQGLDVIVADIEDVYDEFSFGQESPQALHEFLAHAYASWERPPQFALLVGDATFDPRDYLGFGGERNQVPTYFVATAALETASDDWFGDFDGDGVPEIAVGRLPVATQEEAAGVVEKLVGYARSGNDGGWRDRVLLVADHDEAFDFESGEKRLFAAVPAHYAPQEILRGAADSATTRQAIIDEFNRGSILVNYFGHGSVEVWSGEGLLTEADTITMRNKDREPLVVAMTCLNGFFHDLYTKSLAESLLRTPRGGAIGVWSSSGLTEPAAQLDMNTIFLQAVLTEPWPALGDAVKLAKAAATSDDVRRTWVLLGDPSMRLGSEEKPADRAIDTAALGCGCEVGAPTDPKPIPPLCLLIVLCCAARGHRTRTRTRQPSVANARELRH